MVLVELTPLANDVALTVTVPLPNAEASNKPVIELIVAKFDVGSIE